MSSQNPDKTDGPPKIPTRSSENINFDTDTDESECNFQPNIIFCTSESEDNCGEISLPVQWAKVNLVQRFFTIVVQFAFFLKLFGV